MKTLKLETEYKKKKKKAMYYADIASSDFHVGKILRKILP